MPRRTIAHLVGIRKAKANRRSLLLLLIYSPVRRQCQRRFLTAASAAFSFSSKRSNILSFFGLIPRVGVSPYPKLTPLHVHLAFIKRPVSAAKLPPARGLFTKRAYYAYFAMTLASIKPHLARSLAWINVLSSSVSASTGHCSYLTPDRKR